MKFNPLDYPATFLEPLVVSQLSAWIEHIPFAYTLMSMLRPHIVVELGVQAGDSYCAFCQAVQYLSLSTKCFGIDTWQGDLHAGAYSLQVLNKLRSHHDVLYLNYSTLMQMEFDAAAPAFELGSIDLLHIDGFHTYEAVKHDFETWLPKLSERGVVLFHDTIERSDDFGVHQLWDELVPQYPTFQFEHGAGLGVLAAGKVIPEELKPFFFGTAEEKTAIRNFYLKLGREIGIRRYYSGVMRKVFRSQSLINQWKKTTGRPMAPESQQIQVALGNPAGFAENLMHDVHQLAAAGLELWQQQQK